MSMTLPQSLIQEMLEGIGIVVVPSVVTKQRLDVVMHPSHKASYEVLVRKDPG